jgi:hypothetical protein
MVEGGEGFPVLADFLPQIVAEVAIVLGEGLRNANLDSGPAEVWATGIVGMIHLAGHTWIERKTMPRARLVAYLTDLVWNGLAGAGVPTAEASRS